MKSSLKKHKDFFRNLANELGPQTNRVPVMSSQKIMPYWLSQLKAGRRKLPGQDNGWDSTHERETSEDNWGWEQSPWSLHMPSSCFCDIDLLFRPASMTSRTPNRQSKGGRAVHSLNSCVFFVYISLHMYRYLFNAGVTHRLVMHVWSFCPCTCEGAKRLASLKAKAKAKAKGKSSPAPTEPDETQEDPEEPEEEEE